MIEPTTKDEGTTTMQWIRTQLIAGAVIGIALSALIIGALYVYAQGVTA